MKEYNLVYVGVEVCITFCKELCRQIRCDMLK